MNEIEAIKLAAAAAGGCAVTLLAVYKFFTPRDTCEQKHKAIHKYLGEETARGLRHDHERKEFLELRRDVRWQGAIVRSIAEHLGIVVPEEPAQE